MFNTQNTHTSNTKNLFVNAVHSCSIFKKHPMLPELSIATRYLLLKLVTSNLYMALEQIPMCEWLSWS